MKLADRPLDWAAAIAVSRNDLAEMVCQRPQSYVFRPSTSWEHAGMILDALNKQGCEVKLSDGYCAIFPPGTTIWYGHTGATTLIALTRSFVAFVLGNEVDVPEALIETHKEAGEAPELCYVAVPERAELGIVKWGEKGYFKTSYGPFQTSKDAQTFANEMNARLGISPAVAEAMLAGSLFGWEIPAVQQIASRPSKGEQAQREDRSA